MLIDTSYMLGLGGNGGGDGSTSYDCAIIPPSEFSYTTSYGGIEMSCHPFAEIVHNDEDSDAVVFHGSWWNTSGSSSSPASISLTIPSSAVPSPYSNGSDRCDMMQMFMFDAYGGSGTITSEFPEVQACIRSYWGTHYLSNDYQNSITSVPKTTRWTHQSIDGCRTSLYRKSDMEFSTATKKTFDLSSQLPEMTTERMQITTTEVGSLKFAVMEIESRGSTTEFSSIRLPDECIPESDRKVPLASQAWVLGTMLNVRSDGTIDADTEQSTFAGTRLLTRCTYIIHSEW